MKSKGYLFKRNIFSTQNSKLHFSYIEIYIRSWYSRIKFTTDTEAVSMGHYGRLKNETKRHLLPNPWNLWLLLYMAKEWILPYMVRDVNIT